MIGDLLGAIVSWQSLLLVLIVFGFAPGALLRVIVRAFRPDDSRRRELLADLHAVPRIERPFWVLEQLEVALFDGLVERFARIEVRRGHRDQRNGGLIRILRLSLLPLQVLRGNVRLATSIIEAAVRLLPARHRNRYLDEWLADLDQLCLKGKPLLGMAIRVLLQAPWIAAIRRGRDLGRSIEAEVLGVRSPLWFGGLVAIVTFATFGAVIYLRQDPPTRTQVVFAVVASLGSGALAALQERKQQRSEHRQHRSTRS